MSRTRNDYSIIRRATNLVSSEIGGEVVILGARTGRYYGLDGPSAEVWRLLECPTSLDQIKRALLEEYEVEPEQCEQELRVMLAELQAEGLIEVQL